MIRKYLVFLMTGVILFSSGSCKDDKPIDPPEPGTTTYTLSQGLGILEDIDDEGLTYYRILLSSIPADEDWTFDGAGQALYLELVGPSIDYDNEIGLPAGTYKYSTSSDKALSIVSGTGSRFEHLDNDGKGTIYGITEGEIVVTQTSGRYNITGTVKSSTKDSVFTFKFDSNITFTDEYNGGESGEDFDGEFTSAEVYYRNKFYGTPADSYVITFTDEKGYTASLEIITPGAIFHYMVPEGKYTYAKTQIANYNLLGQEDTYVIWGVNAERKDIEAGEIDITDHGDGTFTVEGSFTPENGDEIEFTFNGKLNVNKLRMVAYDADLMAIGPYWARHASQYDFELHFNTGSGYKSNTVIVISTEYKWWYDVWPIDDGIYPWYENEDDYADVNIFFGKDYIYISRNRDLDMYQEYEYYDGIFEISSQRVSGDDYRYNIQGTTKAIIKNLNNLYEEEGKEIEIEIIYNGVPGYLGKQAAAKPASMLKNDLEVNDFVYLRATYAADYWHDEPNVTQIKSNCMILFLATENAEENWFDWEEEDYWMYINLNIPLNTQSGLIPTGVYTPNHEFTYEPYTFNLGWDSNYTYQEWGTYIYTFDEDPDGNFGRVSISPNDPGSIEITKDNQDVYTIKINVYDDQAYQAKKISGTFVGPIDDFISNTKRSGMRGNDGMKMFYGESRRMDSK